MMSVIKAFVVPLAFVVIIRDKMLHNLRVLRMGYVPLPIRKTGKLEYALLCISAWLTLTLQSSHAAALDFDLWKYPNFDLWKRICMSVGSGVFLLSEFTLAIAHAVGGMKSHGNNPLALFEMMATRMEQCSIIK